MLSSLTTIKFQH